MASIVGFETSRQFGIVSTYPPTSCGLATFAAALRRGMVSAGARNVGIVRCIDGVDGRAGSEVVSTWNVHERCSTVQATKALDGFDTIFLQHEYGIFGPDDGAGVLDLLELVDRPIVSTLHTVPMDPTRRQKFILERLVRRSDSVVAMTMAAQDRLLAGYDVDPTKVVVIPHGATRPGGSTPTDAMRSYVLTWGLLGPGKGIEWVIEALGSRELRDMDLRYMVMGRTHPKVRAREGDAYVDALRGLAHDLGVSSRVTFDDTYHDLGSLLDRVRRASCVVLPYDSADQITSGVLVDAIAAGKPVIATRFPHSAELLSSGAGVVVPHRDPAALANALQSILGDAKTYESMVDEAERLARIHDWTSVARRYMALGAGVRMADGAVA